MNMAQATYRNNIEPMLASIAQMMMVVSCGFFAFITLECFCWRQFTRTNRTRNCRMHSIVEGMFLLIFTDIFYCMLLAFFGLVILEFCFFVTEFTLFRLMIFSKAFCGKFFAVWCMVSAQVTGIFTQTAVVAMAILAIRPYPKVLKWFCLLADDTLFVYNLLSHIRFLNKRQWLEPMAVRPVIGSFHYSTQRGGVK